MQDVGHSLSDVLRREFSDCCEGDSPRVYCPKPQADGIRDSEVTLGEALTEAGYETAFYGKGHMGS